MLETIQHIAVLLFFIVIIGAVIYIHLDFTEKFNEIQNKLD